MLAKDITVPTAVSLHPSSTIHEAIHIFRHTKLGGIPVVDSDQRLIGMFTRSNLFDCLLRGVSIDTELTGHFITDLIYFKEDVAFNNLAELNQWLRKVKIGQTPVVDHDSRPIGFITRVFIINFLLDHIEKYYQKINASGGSQKKAASRQTGQDELFNINGTKYTIDSIISVSARMEELKRLALKAAQTASTVLISGECGTGKELFAQAIHNASNRWVKPFVNINCAAIPAELAESELFGYESGAFTGASKHGKPGKFELADSSTIFLDEIGDMPLPLQGKLLRIIQEKEVIRVGGLHPKKVDARIIVSTNCDLPKLCNQSKFRQDLYYRLNVISLVIPPLREHPEDIPALINHFIHEHCKLINRKTLNVSKEAIQFMLQYHWPGNIRELNNVIERAVLFCDGNTIELEDLGFNQNNESEAYNGSLSAIEKATISNALKAAHGNKTKTAKLLGISRSTLYNKMKKMELKLPEVFLWK